MKHKFPSKDTALRLVQSGRAGSVYRKDGWWCVTTFKKPKRKKEFVLSNGFRNTIEEYNEVLYIR